MKIICRLCKKYVGETAPFGNTSELYGKCRRCLAKKADKFNGKTLSVRDIDTALSKIRGSIRTYYWIQSNLRSCDVSTNRDFQRRFNGFYRVRRSREWQQHYYRLMERSKIRKPAFKSILAAIRKTTNRLEPSFASKLVATIDPNKPVIDQHVLNYFGLKMPVYGRKNREEGIVEIYGQLVEKYKMLMNGNGQIMQARFKRFYSNMNNQISDLKKMDFVLWQSRPVINAPIS